MRDLQGEWNYQSFCPSPAVADRTTVPPSVRRSALAAAPWTPPSVMNFMTDAAGKITGSAKLGPLEFKITGSITPPADSIPERAASNLPEGIALLVTVESTGTVYNLRGYFLAGSDHLVGTVVAISNDLGFHPPGTSGPFVLYPVKAMP